MELVCIDWYCSLLFALYKCINVITVINIRNKGKGVTVLNLTPRHEDVYSSDALKYAFREVFIWLKLQFSRSTCSSTDLSLCHFVANAQRLGSCMHS
jgi:hypothetical protein